MEENWQTGILVGLLYGGAYFFFGTFAKMASDAEARKKRFPGDEEFEQAMNFVEKFMRRFFEFAKSMKDQIGKET